MKEDEYKTKDIGEAAALYSSGLKLLRLEKVSNFYLFVFKNDEAEKIANSYWSDELSVKAKTYNDSFRTLKERIFSLKSSFNKDDL